MTHLCLISVSSWIWYISMAAYAFIIVSAIVVVLSENRNPIRALAWVIALLSLPVIGLVFYLFFGRSLKGRHMMSRRNKRRLLNDCAPQKIDMDRLELAPDARVLVRLAHNLSHAPMMLNNRIEIFTEGAAKFAALEKDLRRASHSILLQYYIFSDDNIGKKISDILIEKARQGVSVKVIYDHVGSFSASNSFFRRMQEAGIDTHPFFRVTFPQLANRINWRNHRKIVVIDGAIGYIGGMNIADRYVTGSETDHAWRDTHFRVEGDIVESLAYSFALDWNFMKKTPQLQPVKVVRPGFSNNLGMQLVNSGPTEPYDNLTLCFLKAISCAKKSIFIQTPYFLPTDTLLHALETAALSKLDVRIVMPSKSDSSMLCHASFSYITQCLRVGIKVYLYDPGMIHAKCMIIDDDFVTAGSTNFDFRSFENNFECNLLIYDREVNSKMRDIFFNDLSHCRKLTLAKWRSRPLRERFLESVTRLCSPIL